MGLREFASSLGKNISGHNNPLRDLASLRKEQGKFISAALLALYGIPLRWTKPGEQYGFVNGIVTSTDYYEELHALFTVDKAEGFDLIRTGRNTDGGYVMLNDFHEGGIAYSFGICDDVSWDKDIASKGYDIFMYDHTIEGLPEENSRFHWSKFGIADGTTNDERLKTLEYFIEKNHHQEKRDMILKMDVEGAEWGFLENVKTETLKQFSQITFEFHHMINPSNPDRILKILRKLNETHQLIHIHPNNLGRYVTVGGKNFSESPEVSYVLRGKYKFAGNYDVALPIELDVPNTPLFPDVALGHWNSEMKPNEGLIFHLNKEHFFSEV